MTIKTYTCEDCDQTFESEPVQFGGKTIFEPRKCDACVEKAVNDQTQDALSRREKVCIQRFQMMIPPIYHESDITRLPEALVMATEMWSMNPKGIGFIGKSGKGKTRAAVMLLKRMHHEDHNVFFISATDLALNSANQFADNPATKQIAKAILAQCKSADLLLLDDIGKGRMTDRAESELYDLLEYRTSRRLPTIWTSNSDGKQLREMFSADRGEAIIRRLASEFSTIVKL
jgi:hypothetical protein